MKSSAPISRARRAIRSVAVIGVMAVVGALLSVADGATSAFADGGTASVRWLIRGLANTADDGTYTFPGVPAGSYTLQFDAPNGRNYVSQCWKDLSCTNPSVGVTYFPVADGQVLTGYDAQLVVGGTD